MSQYPIVESPSNVVPIQPPNLTKSIWVEPMELFRRPDFWPFYNGDNGVKYVNSIFRTMLLGLGILAWYNGTARLGLVILIIYFVVATVIAQMKANESGGLDASPEGYNAQKIMKKLLQTQQDKRPDINYQKEVCELRGDCLPLDNTSLVWGPDNLVARSSGSVAPALYEPVLNPYGNPLLMDYDAAVRSVPNNSVLREYGDSIFDRMWAPVGQPSQGLFFSTMPDTTLMAATRGVPMPSLIGDVRALP